MRNIDVYKAQAAARSLTESNSPTEAIRKLMQLAETPQASAFERYAASVLRNAGARELIEPGRPRISMRKSGEGRSVRLSTPSSPGNSQAGVRSLEDALNRLLGVTDALTEGIGARLEEAQDYARTRRRALFASYGIEYPLWSDTTRGAHVRLPALDVGNPATEEYYNEIDWRLLDTVANNAHVFFQAAILTNLNQTIFGLKAPAGSEWDVRTRLASIMRDMEAPLRVSYTFDCDTSRNICAIRFSVPSAKSFPTLPGSPGRGDMEAARMAYALRFATLLGASCFGSGRIVEHASVTGIDADGRTLIACEFERGRFVRETLPIVDSGEFGAPELRFDPRQLTSMMSAEQVHYASECNGGIAREASGANGSGSAREAGSAIGSGSGRGGEMHPANRFADMRKDPWEDERELPADLQRFFHAKRVQDIDTSHYHGGAAALIDEAKADSLDSMVAAIAQLEGIAAEFENGIQAPADQPDARPLYCEHPLARAAIVLLDEELSISHEAEAFLNPEGPVPDSSLPSVYYHRAPDALFHARVGLADLYRQLGDARGAETQADRCIALGPTTPVGYALKADALAGQGRFKEAANVIMSGLRYAVAETDQAFLLHDLAQLFWRMGRGREASAVHIYTSTLPGLYAGKSLEFVRQLAGDASVHAYVQANLNEAAGVIRETGIPLISERTRQSLLTRAALGLANAHMPRAAAPYIVQIAKRFSTNKTISEACVSIQYGIGK